MARACALALFAYAGSVVAQPVYKSTMPDGKVVYGEKPVAGVLQMTKEWEGVPPHWMPYFQVSDTDASAKLAEQNGGNVSVPPFDTPWGRIAVITGPSGEAFSIMKPAPS